MSVKGRNVFDGLKVPTGPASYESAREALRLFEHEAFGARFRASE